MGGDIERRKQTIAQAIAALIPDRAIKASAAAFPWGIYSVASAIRERRLEAASSSLESAASLTEPGTVTNPSTQRA